MRMPSSAGSCLARSSTTTPATTTGSSTFGITDSPNLIQSIPSAGVVYHLTAWVRSPASHGAGKIKVREFKGSVTNRDVVKYGQGIMTAMGLVPEVEKNGLGYMDPEMVKRTRETVVTYMGAAGAPPPEQIATNAFVGKVKLSAAEWSAVRESVKRYIPKGA